MKLAQSPILNNLENIVNTHQHIDPPGATQIDQAAQEHPVSYYLTHLLDIYNRAKSRTTPLEEIQGDIHHLSTLMAGFHNGSITDTINGNNPERTATFLASAHLLRANLRAKYLNARPIKTVFGTKRRSHPLPLSFLSNTDHLIKLDIQIAESIIGTNKPGPSYLPFIKEYLTSRGTYLIDGGLSGLASLTDLALTGVAGGICGGIGGGLIGGALGLAGGAITTVFSNNIFGAIFTGIGLGAGGAAVGGVLEKGFDVKEGSGAGAMLGIFAGGIGYYAIGCFDPRNYDIIFSGLQTGALIGTWAGAIGGLGYSSYLQLFENKRSILPVPGLERPCVKPLSTPAPPSAPKPDLNHPILRELLVAQGIQIDEEAAHPPSPPPTLYQRVVKRLRLIAPLAVTAGLFMYGVNSLTSIKDHYMHHLPFKSAVVQDHRQSEEGVSPELRVLAENTAELIRATPFTVAWTGLKRRMTGEQCIIPTLEQEVQTADAELKKGGQKGDPTGRVLLNKAVAQVWQSKVVSAEQSVSPLLAQYPTSYAVRFVDGLAKGYGGKITEDELRSSVQQTCGVTEEFRLFERAFETFLHYNQQKFAGERSGNSPTQEIEFYTRNMKEFGESPEFSMLRGISRLYIGEYEGAYHDFFQMENLLRKSTGHAKPGGKSVLPSFLPMVLKGEALLLSNGWGRAYSDLRQAEETDSLGSRTFLLLINYHFMSMVDHQEGRVPVQKDIDTFLNLQSVEHIPNRVLRLRRLNEVFTVKTDADLPEVQKNFNFATERLRRAPDSDAYTQRGALYLVMGKPDLAVADLKSAVTVSHPLLIDPRLYLSLAQVSAKATSNSTSGSSQGSISSSHHSQQPPLKLDPTGGIPSLDDPSSQLLYCYRINPVETVRFIRLVNELSGARQEADQLLPSSPPALSFGELITRPSPELQARGYLRHDR